MNSIVTVRPLVRGRLALIAAGIFALLCSFVVTAPAQAGYYEGYNPCSYRCGYPAYRPYPAYRYYPRYRQGCYSCGRHLIYERRYVEREYVERRYGYGGYRRHYGSYPYGAYRSWQRPLPWGYGYGHGGVGRRWPTPSLYGYESSADRYVEPPRPPAPVWGGTGYEADPYGYEN